MMYFWCCTRQKALSVKSDKVLNIYICVIWICLEFRISNYRITAYATISYHQSSVFCLLSTAFGTLYICREFSTNRPFYAKQTQFFMQNKPNSPNVQIYINFYYIKDYQNFIPLAGPKNKPNSNPIKPNFKKAKMNISLTLTKDYRKKDDFSVRINKPNFVKGPKLTQTYF